MEWIIGVFIAVVVVSIVGAHGKLAILNWIDAWNSQRMMVMVPLSRIARPSKVVFGDVRDDER